MGMKSNSKYHKDSCYTTFTRKTLQSIAKYLMWKVETSILVTIKTIKHTLSKFLIWMVEERTAERDLVRKPEGKRKFVGLRRRRKHYIKKCLENREREFVDWFQFFEDGKHLRAVVCKMTNTRIP